MSLMRRNAMLRITKETNGFRNFPHAAPPQTSTMADREPDDVRQQHIPFGYAGVARAVGVCISSRRRTVTAGAGVSVSFAPRSAAPADPRRACLRVTAHRLGGGFGPLSAYRGQVL